MFCPIISADCNGDACIFWDVNVNGCRLPYYLANPYDYGLTLQKISADISEIKDSLKGLIAGSSSGKNNQ